MLLLDPYITVIVVFGSRTRWPPHHDLLALDELLNDLATMYQLREATRPTAFYGGLLADGVAIVLPAGLLISAVRARWASSPSTSTCASAP